MTLPRLRAGLLVLAIAAVCIPVACSSESDDAATDGPEEPTSTRISADAGGTVTDPSGNTTLTIPPGALEEDTDITLEILPKAGAALVEISDFGPDGLTFLKPATLSIKGDAALAPDGTLLLAVDEGSGFTEIAGSTYADGAATGEITHFSSYTLIAGDGGGDLVCETTGGLPPPAVGQATIEATFSEVSADFSGNSAPFTGPPEFGSTTPYGESFTGRVKQFTGGVDPDQRDIRVNVTQLPAACQTFTFEPTAFTSPNVLYVEGGGGLTQWWCGGTIIVDTVDVEAVDRTSYTFHFDVTCEPPPQGGPEGTFRLTGKGAGAANPDA